MITNKKIISALLALLMFATVTLVACSDTGGGSKETTLSNGTTTVDEEDVEQLDSLDARQLVSDNLPTEDFGGREFRISAANTYDYEIDVETLTGDVCEDAIYNRNRLIEERFNIEIVALVNESPKGQPTFVSKSILAGDDVFDLAGIMTFLSGGVILQNLFHNWKSVPYVDFEKPWWVQSANTAFSIGDNMYAAVGDFSISTLLLSYGVFFNKQQVENYNIPDLYQTVYDGKWTIDYLNEISTDIYQDLNGDNQADETDFYGFTAEKVTNLDVYPSAFDIPLIKKDSNNYPVIDIDVEKITLALEKVYNLYYNSPGSNIVASAGDEIKHFAKGNAVFITTWMDNAFADFREMSNDYGIIPYPKLNEAQTNYYTNSMDNYTMLSIPVTATDLDFIGIITEALTVESYKSVMPAYYDIALQTKYTRDEDSVAMLEIIMDGRNYDFSILHGAYLENLPYMFRDLIAAESTDFTSKFAAVELKMETGLQTVIDTYNVN